MKYKLSIVVPTYNGAGWIRDTLESVLIQLGNYKDKVELVVRDNNSADDTESIVQKLNERYGYLIRYDKRSTTAIADVNFREAVMLSEGEYILLLGDDDLLFPYFLEISLRILNETPCLGLLYYNRICTSRNYEGASLNHCNPCKEFRRDYECVEDFIKDYPSGPDFMSANVVKRECIILGQEFTKQEYYGVEWYASMLYGLKNYKCTSLFYPMVLQRAPNKRYWDDRALLYVVVGLNNMFEDLSVIYPTAYQSWRSYADKNIVVHNYLIKCIPLNRTLYKKKWKELSLKLDTSQRIIAFILVFLPFLTSFVRIGIKIIYKISYYLRRVFHNKE